MVGANVKSEFDDRCQYEAYGEFSEDQLVHMFGLESSETNFLSIPQDKEFDDSKCTGVIGPQNDWAWHEHCKETLDQSSPKEVAASKRREPPTSSEPSLPKRSKESVTMVDQETGLRVEMIVQHSYLCPQCSFKSDRKFNVKRHRTSAHSSLPNFRADEMVEKLLFLCRFCNFGSDRKFNVKRHALSVHSAQLPSSSPAPSAKPKSETAAAAADERSVATKAKSLDRRRVSEHTRPPKWEPGSERRSQLMHSSSTNSQSHHFNRGCSMLTTGEVPSTLHSTHGNMDYPPVFVNQEYNPPHCNSVSPMPPCAQAPQGPASSDHHGNHSWSQETYMPVIKAEPSIPPQQFINSIPIPHHNWQHQSDVHFW